MSSKTFPRNPLLSNSKFETYKLSHPKVSTSSITLPGAPVTQARVQHGKTTLSAHEVGSRIRHDHLQKCFGGWLGWVDECWEMWAMKLKTNLEPTFSSLGSLPVPMEKDDAPPSEYPSLHALSPTTYVCSDGYGRLYPLLVQPGASLTAKLGPSYELSDPASGDLRPFKVEWVGGDRRALVSAVRRTKTDDGWGKEEGWDLLLVTFGEEWSEGLVEVDDSDDEAMGDVKTDSGSRMLEVLWALEGKDAPVLAHCNGSQFLLASSEPYILPGSEQIATSSSPSAPAPTVPAVLPQHPFSWAQSSSSVTVSISLPPSTPRAHIHPSILTKSLSVLVGESSSSQTSLDGFSKRFWWDSIKSDESYWEWDAKGGYLTIELEKTNPNTRWPHLFLPTGLKPDYVDVPETLSADDKKAIAADLGRFTSDLDLPDSAPGGIASIMREEMDIDDDMEDEGLAADGEARVGHLVRFTVVDAVQGRRSVLEEGAEISATVLPSSETLVAGALEWTQSGFVKAEDGIPDVLIKHSLDALLYAPPDSPSTTFKHVKTFPALSFVLASKRFTKYILHSSTTSPATVMAFSTPTNGTSQGDVFVYRDADGQTTAPSSVVKLGGGEDGELLGVKGVKVGEEKALVALCETRIVIIKGLL